MYIKFVMEYVSQVSNVSLLQYVTMVFSLCNTVHNQPCLCCPPLLKVADIVLKEGACPLRQAFELTSPGVAYDSEKAQRKLLVMPLASIRMGDPSLQWGCFYFIDEIHSRCQLSKYS